jgi:hypothetical protein
MWRHAVLLKFADYLQEPTASKFGDKEALEVEAAASYDT